MPKTPIFHCSLCSQGHHELCWKKQTLPVTAHTRYWHFQYYSFPESSKTRRAALTPNLAALRSQKNHLGCKRHLGSPSPAVHPAPPPRSPLEHIHTAAGHFQEWWIHHCPVPALCNPSHEETFPYIHSKPPLAQLEVVPSCPVSCNLSPTWLLPPVRDLQNPQFPPALNKTSCYHP